MRPWIMITGRPMGKTRVWVRGRIRFHVPLAFCSLNKIALSLRDAIRCQIDRPDYYKHCDFIGSSQYCWAARLSAGPWPICQQPLILARVLAAPEVRLRKLIRSISFHFGINCRHQISRRRQTDRISCIFLFKYCRSTFHRSCLDCPGDRLSPCCIEIILGNQDISSVWQAANPKISAAPLPRGSEPIQGQWCNHFRVTVGHQGAIGNVGQMANPYQWKRQVNGQPCTIGSASLVRSRANSKLLALPLWSGRRPSEGPPAASGVGRPDAISGTALK